MGKDGFLGEFEQMLLLAAMQLEDALMARVRSAIS